LRRRIVLCLLVHAAAACGFNVAGSQENNVTSDDGGGVPIVEAGTSVDTGSQSPDGGAGDDGGVKKVGFCANEPPHEACLDFEDGKVDALGAAPTIVLGGTIVVEGTRAVSLPNALHVGNGSQIGSQAYIFKSWPSRSQVDVAFDVWADGDGYGQIGGIEVFATNVTGSYQMLFTTDGGQLGFVEVVNTIPTTHPLTGTKQTWHHVDVHLELIASATQKSRLLIREDKVTRFDGEVFLIMPFINSVKANLGLNYSAKASPVNVYIDNATIDSRP
jgi:hypothetical protein